jgi:iron(III) transport system permease protein
MDQVTIAPRRAAVPGLRAALRRWASGAMPLLRDPTLGLGLLGAMLFAALFVVLPLVRVIWQAFFDQQTGAVSLEYFARYLDPVYRDHQWMVLWNTLVLGLGAAAGGTLLGFVFAFALTRCDMPFGRVLHFATLIPTISPPFAIAIATILLFGRAGLITRDWLGIRFGPATNDIYGLDGLMFVQIVTFFPVAYLILRAMLERVDPAMEEAALNLGASRLHVFRTVTLPLLIPGIAGSFLLLFVESLADLGNPLLLGGNSNVLATEIFLAVNGQYDQQRGAAFSLVLLLPTLAVFLLQRYWVNKRSYVSVTGKPTGGHVTVRDPLIRWPAIGITLLTMLLIVTLYGSILVGSFTKLWGIDYSLDLRHYSVALTRGLTPILATTFLSAVATPLAGLIGIVIAYLVVRKAFAGKETLDFVSNLGAAVPGTILGIGYIIAFIRPPMLLVVATFLVLAWYMIWGALQDARRRWGVFALGLALGAALWWAAPLFANSLWLIVLALPLLVFGVMLARSGARSAGWLLAFPGVYLLLGLVEPALTAPLATFGRSLGGNSAKLLVSLADMIALLFRVPTAFVGFSALAIGALSLQHPRVAGQLRLIAGAVVVGVAFALIFNGEPLALVGTPYIVIMAYAVRSLPASVRAGMAALQQIDPAIEEASINLGADAQTTFRKVTIPLIMPALLAGLVFAFARHMTSLSAIIFLTTPKWPILTVWILSEVEQGGLSTAAAYSVILIAIVLGAIMLMYALVSRRARALGGVDISVGGG